MPQIENKRKNTLFFSIREQDSRKTSSLLSLTDLALRDDRLRDSQLAIFYFQSSQFAHFASWTHASFDFSKMQFSRAWRT